MRVIRVSEEVWEQIAKRGKLGETEDDVLRREFGIEPGRATESGSVVAAAKRNQPRPRSRFAQTRMHAAVHSEHLVVQFEGGEERRWKLPEKSDKAMIRQIRDEAVSFALDQGASDPGQTNAVRKALTDASYHLVR
jgi:hypothetical protein